MCKWGGAGSDGVEKAKKRRGKWLCGWADACLECDAVDRGREVAVADSWSLAVAASPTRRYAYDRNGCGG